MDKWAICILLSSFSGSMLYGIWLIAARIFRKDDFLYALQCSINVVIILFSALALGGIGMYFHTDLQPGSMSWPIYTNSLQNVLAWLFCIWILGVIWKIALYVFRCYQMRELAKTYMPCDIKIRPLLEDVCREMGIRKKVAMVQSFSVPVARIEGVIRPRICIPAVEYKEDELRAILKHELAHYLNYDGWIRECAILLECAHWFNPLVKSMHRNLERWDEYYCDYLVCNRYGVSKECYINTLVATAEMVVKWREEIRKSSIIDLNFTESGKNLKERIERIMNYKGQMNQRRVFSAVLCVLFVFMGSTVALAAGSGMEILHTGIIRATYDNMSSLEMESDTVDLQEYVMTPEETALIRSSLTGGEAVPFAKPTAPISSTITNEWWQSGRFKASSGQSIYVSVTGTPNDIYLKVGIIEPNGAWRYVYDCGNIDHTFALDQTGTYVVFVWNETDTEVAIIGYYATSDAK